jgi:hypothetical protein
MGQNKVCLHINVLLSVIIILLLFGWSNVYTHFVLALDLVAAKFLDFDRDLCYLHLTYLEEIFHCHSLKDVTSAKL